MNSRSNEIVVERTFSQQDFDDFAALSGDDNAIHVDPEIAASSRFGRTVAHGVLLCSIIRGLIERLIPGCRQVDQSVMYPAPTFAGETMRFRATLLDSEHGNAHIEFEVTRCNDATVTCHGQCSVRQ